MAVPKSGSHISHHSDLAFCIRTHCCLSIAGSTFWTSCRTPEPAQSPVRLSSPARPLLTRALSMIRLGM